MSHVIEDMGADTSLLTLIKFTSIQRGLIDYIIAIRKWEKNLLFGGEFAGRKHEKDIVEGDAYQRIYEVGVEAISREVSREISRAMYGIVFEAILKVKTEFESREDEDNKQQT